MAGNIFSSLLSLVEVKINENKWERADIVSPLFLMATCKKNFNSIIDFPKQGESSAFDAVPKNIFYHNSTNKRIQICSSNFLHKQN